MEQYPSNSNASKRKTAEAQPEERKIEKVVTGNVIRRKKPLGRKVVEFFGGGDPTTVRQYLVKEIVFPHLQDLLHLAGTAYLDQIVYRGDARGPSVRRGPRVTGSGTSPLGKFNYGSASSTSIRRDPREDPRRTISPAGRARHDFDEIILETRVEADDILTQMFDQLRDYGTVSVADLYRMMGVTSDFTDNKWGWEDLRGSRVRHLPRQGYLLDLPNPIALD